MAEEPSNLKWSWERLRALLQTMLNDWLLNPPTVEIENKNALDDINNRLFVRDGKNSWDLVNAAPLAQSGRGKRKFTTQSKNYYQARRFIAGYPVELEGKETEQISDFVWRRGVTLGREEAPLFIMPTEAIIADMVDLAGDILASRLDLLDNPSWLKPDIEANQELQTLRDSDSGSDISRRARRNPDLKLRKAERRVLTDPKNVEYIIEYLRNLERTGEIRINERNISLVIKWLRSKFKMSENTLHGYLTNFPVNFVQAFYTFYEGGSDFETMNHLFDYAKFVFKHSFMTYSPDSDEESIDPDPTMFPSRVWGDFYLQNWGSEEEPTFLFGNNYVEVMFNPVLSHKQFKIDGYDVLVRGAGPTPADDTLNHLVWFNSAAEAIKHATVVTYKADILANIRNYYDFLTYGRFRDGDEEEDLEQEFANTTLRRNVDEGFRKASRDAFASDEERLEQLYRYAKKTGTPYYQLPVQKWRPDEVETIKPEQEVWTWKIENLTLKMECTYYETSINKAIFGINGCASGNWWDKDDCRGFIKQIYRKYGNLNQTLKPELRLLLPKFGMESADSARLPSAIWISNKSQADLEKIIQILLLEIKDIIPKDKEFLEAKIKAAEHAAFTTQEPRKVAEYYQLCMKAEIVPKPFTESYAEYWTLYPKDTIYNDSPKFGIPNIAKSKSGYYYYANNFTVEQYPDKGGFEEPSKQVFFELLHSLLHQPRPRDATINEIEGPPERRNPDERIRKYERAAFSDDPQDKARLLAERLRAGELTEERIQWAAGLGSKEAALLFPAGYGLNSWEILRTYWKGSTHIGKRLLQLSNKEAVSFISDCLEFKFEKFEKELAQDPGLLPSDGLVGQDILGNRAPFIPRMKKTISLVKEYMKQREEDLPRQIGFWRGFNDFLWAETRNREFVGGGYGDARVLLFAVGNLVRGVLMLLEGGEHEGRDMAMNAFSLVLTFYTGSEPRRFEQKWQLDRYIKYLLKEI